jgi:hypothetical protein
MRALLLALCLLAGTSRASAPAGIVNYWTMDSTADDYFGGTALTVNGTVPYDSTGAPTGSATWAGPFADANYYSAPFGNYPTATGSVAFAIRTPGNFKQAWRVGNAGWGRYHGFLWFGGQFYFQYFDAGGVQRNLVYTVSNNTTYYVICNWNASAVQLWVGTTKANVEMRAQNTTDVRDAFTPAEWRIGRDQNAGTAWDGFIGQFWLSNHALTAFPSVPSGATPSGEHSPYLRQMLKLRLRPNWSLLNILFAPPAVQALPSNSPRVREFNKASFDKVEATAYRKRILLLTPTPTATAEAKKSVIGTPTPTPTATATPTPSIKR